MKSTTATIEFPMNLDVRSRSWTNISEQHVAIHETHSSIKPHIIWNIIIRLLESTVTIILVISLFIGFTTTAGIIVICITASKQKGLSCQYTFVTSDGFSPGYNSRPRSAAVTDLNNDTRLDIVVADSEIDSIGIFFGSTNGNFQSQTIVSTGIDSEPYSVVVGDLNNDQYLDIISANHGTNSIGILIGYGDGTFQNVILHSVGSAQPISIATGYFDKDKTLDIVIASYKTSSISILRGYRNGSFSYETKYSTGYDSLPSCIAVADLNNDTNVDVVVVNTGTSNIAVFLGNGDGSFLPYKIYTTGSNTQPSSIVIGDFNGDTRLDIAVSNFQTSTVGVFLGDGNGTFGHIQLSAVYLGSHPYSIGAGDFLKDGVLDLVVANSDSNNVVILHGFSNGTFQNGEAYSVKYGSTPICVIVSDFNNDSQLDLAIVNNGSNSLTIFYRYLTKPFTTPTVYSTGSASFPSWTVLGDFNNDGTSDIIVTNSNTNNIGLFLGYGNGTFSAQRIISFQANSLPNSAVVGDFNNDSRLDIVVANSRIDGIGVILGTGNGNFSQQQTYSTGNDSAPYSVALGDFNRDGLLDISAANFGTNNIGIFLGYGNGSFSNPTMFSTNNRSPLSIAVNDINNDSIVDIILACPNTNDIGILLGYGNGSFGQQQAFSTGNNTLPIQAIIADFNMDTKPDIAVTNFGDNNIGILFGIGNGSFYSVRTYFTGDGSQPQFLIANDFNNDNIPDVAFTLVSSNQIGIFFGYGDGTFGKLSVYSTGYGSHPWGIAAGMFNNDKWLDIVITGHDSNAIGVFLGLDMTYQAQVAEYSTGTGSHPYSVSVADFNNDTLPDILAVYLAHDSIGIRLGNGDGSFANETEFFTEAGSRPQFATAGDVNNDSRMDIIITNTLNDSVTVAYGAGDGSIVSKTVYSTGSLSSPCFAALADLNTDKQLDLTVVNSGTNSIGVFLSYRYATFKVQSYLSTGTLSNPIAMTMGDLNGDNLPDIVVSNYQAANTGVFLGQNNGSFTKQQSYFTGNLSSPFSVALGDFNNDTSLDIVVANVGTNTIGILFGYGNGTFSAIRTIVAENGSSPHSVVVGDFNKDNVPDIAIANSGLNTIRLILGYDNGNFSQQRTLSTGSRSFPYALALGDFNNDTCLDIAVANYLSSTVGIFLGYGNGSFAPQSSISVANARPNSVCVGDFNTDERLDIAMISQPTGQMIVLLGNGNGSFTKFATYSTGAGSLPTMVAVGDLNNDAYQDIAVTNYGSNTIAMFFGYGNGRFTEQMALATGSGSAPTATVIRDFNNDGRSDIATINFLAGNLMVFFGIGNQPYLNMITYSTGNNSHPQSLVIRDFNNDSFSDIIVVNRDNDNIGLLLGYGNGAFMNQTTISTGNGSRPCSIAAADFNNDSLLDLAIANRDANSISIFFGYGNGSFSVSSSYTRSEISRPYSIAVADFNNDNYLDIAIANVNSKNVFILFGNTLGTFEQSQSYGMGYGSQLYSVAVGDFNRDNRMDMVVANYGGDEIDILLQICIST